MAGLGEVIDPAQAQAHPEMPPAPAELAQRNLAEGAATMRAARQAGVKIALGMTLRILELVPLNFDCVTVALVVRWLPWR